MVGKGPYIDCMGSLRQRSRDGVGSNSSRFGALNFAFLLFAVDFLLRINVFWIAANNSIEFECLGDYRYFPKIGGYLIDSVLHVPPQLIPPYWLMVLVVLVLWILWFSELVIAQYRGERLRWNQMIVYGVCAMIITGWSAALFQLHSSLQLEWFRKKENGYPTAEEVCDPSYYDYRSFDWFDYEQSIDWALLLMVGAFVASLLIMFSINRSAR